MCRQTDYFAIKNPSMHCETLEQTQSGMLKYVFFLWMITILPACQNNSNILGTYRIYSNDPAVQQWIVGENTYLKLNSDHTIIYNSTMNGKQRFHFEGKFTLDQSTNTLTIQWQDGKLPGKLRIEQKGQDYIIQIGTTTYKKENASS